MIPLAERIDRTALVTYPSARDYDCRLALVLVGLIPLRVSFCAPLYPKLR